jgi:AhpC/TSA family protein
MDLPVWQALYEELAAQNFTVITVAMDSGGAKDARSWIEEAKPTHPSLIDTQHVVAELYGWVNVPSNAWIDEEGRIVRPNDPGFAGEYFRGMMEPGFDWAAMRAEYGRMRDRYLDAVRDWVANGARSRWALTPDQVRERLRPPNPDHARAAGLFRLGTLLHEQARTAEAQAAFAEAKRLRPESWNFKRQAWHLEEPGKSGGPEFWAEVKALGDRPYYPRHEL